MKTFPIKIESTLDPSILEIRWMPHNACNFRCKYCFPGSFEGTDKAPANLDLIVKNFDHLIDYYKVNANKTKFHIKILGGEPTVWKDLEKFIQQMKNKHDAYISIISNGSRTIRWWKENGHLIDNVVLSLHVAQADLDHHIQVADIMYEFGKKVTVLTLMDPDNWDQCKSAVDYIMQHAKHKWFIQAKEVVEFGQGPVMYSDEQKKYLSKEIKRYPSPLWFVKNYKLILDGAVRLYESVAYLNNGTKMKATPQTYINNDWNAFQGWSCDVGLDCLFVDSKGEIKGSCGQPIYNLDYCYNILRDDFAEVFKPDLIASTCITQKCLCQPETHISKRKLS